MLRQSLGCGMLQHVKAYHKELAVLRFIWQAGEGPSLTSRSTVLELWPRKPPKQATRFASEVPRVTLIDE